jgi:hypothetical protein
MPTCIRCVSIAGLRGPMVGWDEGTPPAVRRFPGLRGVTRNLKRSSAIRCHHLIKTFCAGWTDQQLPDGTIILTAPTGHTYRTEPHGAAMFPTLGQSTGELDIAATLQTPDADRGAMMPRRKQTREQDRRDRINAERRERTELIADEERQRQAWLAANYQPPPF